MINNKKLLKFEFVLISQVYYDIISNQNNVIMLVIQIN